MNGLITVLAAAIPWWLRFEHAGLNGGTVGLSLKRALIITWVAMLVLAMGAGLVALGAIGAGALLGRDGMAALEVMLPVWLPVLAVSTLCANQHLFTTGQR